VSVPALRVAVLASGGGSNLQALLDAAQDPEAGFSVVLVVSNRADAGALARAARAGRSAATIREDGQDPERILALFAESGADLVVLAGYLKLVPAAVVSAFRGRMLNIHPALLPAFGGPGMYGRKVHQAVLAAGARVSGATVHVVDEVYDRGRILAQWPVPVAADDTPETLAARVLEAEHRLLPAVVRAWARGGAAAALSLRATAFGPSPSLPAAFDDALAS
jgi:formyltetrahydrofolate-dependent phosphoribosylglycinamide formyltransferase